MAIHPKCVPESGMSHRWVENKIEDYTIFHVYCCDEHEELTVSKPKNNSKRRRSRATSPKVSINKNTTQSGDNESVNSEVITSYLDMKVLSSKISKLQLRQFIPMITNSLRTFLFNISINRRYSLEWHELNEEFYTINKLDFKYACKNARYAILSLSLDNSFKNSSVKAMMQKV